MIKGRIKKWLYLALTILISCILVYFFLKEEKKTTEARFFCGAEHAITVNSNPAFIQEGIIFSEGKQSDEEVFEGDFSVKTAFPNPVALSHEFEVQPGNHIRATVWKKGKGSKACLVISDNNASIFIESIVVDSITNNGWEKLSLDYVVPLNFNKKDMRVMVYNPDTIPAYFDNITTLLKDTICFPETSGPAIEISVSKEDEKNLLRELRNLGIAHVKPSTDFEAYACQININGKKIDGSVELDAHAYETFNQGKWSLKIRYQLNDIDYVLTTRPAIETNFLNEWWTTNWLKDEGVIDDSISFASLSLNTHHLGVHQCKTSIDKNNTITLRWNEAGLWNVLLKNKYQQFFYENVALIADSTTPYLELKQALSTGTKFIKHTHPLPSLTSVDELAKYFAIVNITNAYVGFTVPNYAFEYDLDTKKIRLKPVRLFKEPGDLATIVDNNRPIYGMLPHRAYNEANVDYVFSGCLNDRAFVERYMHYLSLFSDKNYLKTLHDKHAATAKVYTKQLNAEYASMPDFWERVTKKAALIRKALEVYKNQLKTNTLPSFVPFTPEYVHPCEKIKYIEGISVNVLKNLNKKSTYLISNFHCEPVVLLGWGNATEMLQKRSEPLQVDPYWQGGLTPVIVEPDFEYAYLRVVGEEEIRKERVFYSVN